MGGRVTRCSAAAAPRQTVLTALAPVTVDGAGSDAALIGKATLASVGGGDGASVVGREHPTTLTRNSQRIVGIAL